METAATIQAVFQQNLPYPLSRCPPSAPAFDMDRVNAYNPGSSYRKPDTVLSDGMSMTEQDRPAAAPGLLSHGPHRSNDEAFLHCIRCGLCLAVCPTYRATLGESDSPRGRIALARARAEGRLGRSENYADKFFRCLLCAACENICPSGAEATDILQGAREDVSDHELLPGRLAQLDRAISAEHNISAEDNAARLVWADNLPAPPSGLGVTKAELVYFVGCVGSFFPRSYSVPRAFVEILEAAGVDYALLGGAEWCCGYPQYINGELDLAAEAIRHNVDAVRALQAGRVAFTCPSCYHIWKHVYPEALGEPLEVELLHTTELLDRLLDEGQIALKERPMTVTYHDPCDLGRKSGVYDAPRRILRRIPGVTLVEMQENRDSSHCCGGGGNLESHNAELAGQVAQRRVQQAAATGAQVIVSACQQCERTLSNAARASRTRIRVMDIGEVVLQALSSQE
jgi:heterodisulfide reductase subunit D